MISAVIIGSIGVMAETSELRRRAFNLAFEANGLDWHWSPDVFRAMMRRGGGIARIEAYSKVQCEYVNPRVIHGSMVQYFSRLVEEDGIKPRLGLLDLLEAAKKRRIKLAWATTTTEDTVSLMLSGLFPNVLRSHFDFVGHAGLVQNVKPAADIFELTLSKLRVPKEQAIVIEDAPEAAFAAQVAGLETFAFPNEVAADRPFPTGVQILTDLTSLLSDDRSKVA